ncbi:MAG: 5'-methylthioadenosine/adenosylhomocysteine nucleosidase [Erysipelotrichaceae bacterium]|nr:5'-methylthioadenosine/adenosylhomocysteine nucleosidase [Erysipelotrichaceae bacterium]
MIGIICAMIEERDSIVSLMEDVSVNFERLLNYREGTFNDEYYEGKINGRDVVVHHCGVGKAAAAMGTQMLIERYHPDLVINLGCAGSLNENVHVGDIVIADKTADWDFFVPGWPRNFDSIYIANKCSEMVIEIVKELNYKNIHIGPIVSGDQFIMDDDQIFIIKGHFEQALAGEMEGNAVATACYMYGVPCSIIRSISDETLVNDNLSQYEFNLVEVCNKAGRLCYDIISRL